MRSALQMLGGVAVAGVVAVGSTAVTGTGLTSNAGASQFVGGVITQTVTGAILTSVTYAFGDPGPNTTVRSIDLLFSNSDTRFVNVAPSGGGATPWMISSVATATASYAFVCVGGQTVPANAAVLARTAITGNHVTCTAADASTLAAVNTTEGYLGLSSLQITVAAS